MVILILIHVQWAKDPVNPQRTETNQALATLWLWLVCELNNNKGLSINYCLLYVTQTMVFHEPARL